MSVLLAVFFITLIPRAFADELRLRISWGGGRQQQWQGLVRIDEGRLAEPRPLGIEADEPGSMWIEEDENKKSGAAAGLSSSADGTVGQTNRGARLMIRQRSPRAYDGVDLRVEAPRTAKLSVALSARAAADDPLRVEIPLADLLHDFVDKELDDRGNRLLVMRTPGDSLRVAFERDALIFSPGERFHFTVEPHLLPTPEGGQVKLKVQVLSAVDGKEHSSSQTELTKDATEIPLEVTLPEGEGVYDVILTAVNNPSWSKAVRQPLQWNKTLAERRVQVLVLDPRPSLGAAHAAGQFTPLVEIDPANSRWYEVLSKQLQHLPSFSLSKIQHLWKGPLGNGNLQSFRHPLGDLVQLRPSRQSPDASWEAYYLPVGQPGRPHLLEVEYPSDVPQTLGVSIVEPNAAGALAPIGLDSGVDVPPTESVTAEKPRLLTHRLIFWPKTTTPLLLMTNLRSRSPAVYGKIRVLAGGEHLPWAPNYSPRRSGRLAAAYLDRPLFPENFGATESFDQWSGRSLDDWNTFYEGGARLIEYLQHVGYNGLMLTVLADGSTIYPSARLEPTPRYDTGAFFTSGQDPVRKDVLEMLFRLFDREGMQLIPTVDFSSPLPELEVLLRRGGPEVDGLAWIGPDGKPWEAVRPPHRGLAPYYNVLHPRVQKAMAAVLAEVLQRYAQHPSFTGVAVRLSGDGYAQLPGPEWGLDDATIARFQRETKIRVPGEGPRRFAQRAAFFREDVPRHRWLEWRAAELGKFYRRLQEELAALRPDARLYLAGAEMLDASETAGALRPMLPRRTTLADALMRVGFDARHYQAPCPIVFLRPERLAPSSELPAQAFELELSQLGDADSCFQGTAWPGGLFFSPPRELRLPSFDQRSPIKPSYTCLLAQPAPSRSLLRHRWIHNLATLDPQCLFSGGWLLPLGREKLLSDLLSAYRALPAVRFQRVLDEQTSALPVTVRRAVHAGRTYLYAVNDAPFPAKLRLRLAATGACRVEELTSRRTVPPLKSEEGALLWEVNLEPYDFLAVRLSEPQVQVTRMQVSFAPEVLTGLSEAIRRLGARAVALWTPPPAPGLENSDFEKPPADHGAVPLWAATVQEGVTIRLDPATAQSGKQSVRMVSTGPIACLVSRTFSPPRTGRLWMSVWLRVAQANRQPPLRLAIEGRLDGRDYYRYAQVGRPAEDVPQAFPLTDKWAQYIFKVDDLPLEGLTDLRTRFDMMGAGEVWIDDVQLFDLAFNKEELVELSKLITSAEMKLQNGQLGQCVRLLEGYWPRFLEENVPLPDAATAEIPPEPKKPETKESPGVIGRMKNLLPFK
ncbi:MAG: family 10 glycosylhydrolase [Pirellulales bacterium]|nr:family 10 glycosylhydrolase [Pirellulales bacterium]